MRQQKVSARAGIHYIQVIPMAILVILCAWHMYAHLATESRGGTAFHASALGLAFTLSALSLLLRNRDNEAAKHLEIVVRPARRKLIGAACFIIGGIHFLAVTDEPLFMKMAFLVMIMAFFETAGMAEVFLPALSGETADVTAGTLKRLLLNQAGMLTMAFTMSFVLLYLSLTAVVGFTDTWTVGMLSALLLLALAFMTMIRRI